MTPAEADNRGLAWVLGAFVICPCHLPLTLWAIAAILSGTAAGALFHEHVYLAGGGVSALWLAATWRGLRYFRAAARVCEPTGVGQAISLSRNDPSSSGG
jgi:mercuric ion transport protein